MRDVDENLKRHLAGKTTTICNAWRITRRDGLILGFTDHDHRLSFDGTDFKPQSGFLPGAVHSELGLNIDDSEVVGAFSNDAIVERDLIDGRYDGAKVEVFLVNWQRPETALKLRVQEIGEVRFGDHVFHAELRSIAHRLDQPQGRIYSRRCTANLGDYSCKVDLSTKPYHANGTVRSIINDQICVVGGLDEFDNSWFRYGLVKWASGENKGLWVEVHDHVVSEGKISLHFFTPLAHIPQTGDHFTVSAGCAKTLNACRDKFSNVINYQGFPHLPGSDFTYGYADGETIHDGRPIVV